LNFQCLNFKNQDLIENYKLIIGNFRVSCLLPAINIVKDNQYGS
jgi:hypothetical protein